MTSITFDTLQFVKTLEGAGFDGNKAEAVSRVFKEAQQEAGVITKTDIAPIESEMRETELRIGNELTAFRGEVNNEFTAFRGEVNNELTAFRGEINSEFTTFRGEINSEFTAFRGEIKNELTAFRGEINNEFTAIRGEVGSVKNKIDWMMLLVIIAIVSPFLERFFV